jgi:hypothetical protein
MIFQISVALFLIREWLGESAGPASDLENDFPNRHAAYPN